ncbi:MAG: hypothetical protein ACQEQV_03805 [Fibrobacterota bacterium]
MTQYQMYCILILLLFAGGCRNTVDPDFAQKSLETICRDDLQYIVENTDREIRREDPRYEIVHTKEYGETSLFRYLAVVDFYYMDMESVSFKIRRKYRYHVQKRQWERFTNEMVQEDAGYES